MPLLPESSYKPPWLFRNAHVQTIYPALFRRLPITTRERERIETPDGDFLDLDWNYKTISRKLVVLTHGLEGSSRQNYMQGMARIFSDAGWNVLAWNFRGCSGEQNRKLRSYHSGASEELQFVLEHVFSKEKFTEISLIGFSLGGNVTLKYLGERARDLDTRIRSAVVFSVPCDLASSSLKLEDTENRIYMNRFLRSLRKKMILKSVQFPEKINLDRLFEMRTFRDFDGAYTAPIHGFKSAVDYWEKASSKPFLPKIAVPTLMVNALDDPFLSPESYPNSLAQESKFLHLEIPFYGGHVGFVSFGKNRTYWSEHRALEFVSQTR